MSDSESFAFESLYPCLLSGQIRLQFEDFVVNEVPLFHPEGSGEHVWLKIRKQDSNTDWVAGQLARIANVHKKDVGYAGLKDRHAVTTQWFSVHMPGHAATPNWQEALPDEVTVLEENRHLRKLRTGALVGNDFEIMVRDCVGDRTFLDERIKAIMHSGVPNYFGEQRFGKDFSNLNRVQDWFSGGFAPKNRHLKSLLLSSARSWLFNHIIQARIRQQSFSQLLNGEVFQLDASNSWFFEEVNETLQQRFLAKDIHTTAALWGEGELPSRYDVARLENAVIRANELFAKGLLKYRLRQERRSIRVFPKSLSFEWIDNKHLLLKFHMAAGAYATSVLKELVKY